MNNSYWKCWTSSSSLSAGEGLINWTRNSTSPCCEEMIRTASSCSTCLRSMPLTATIASPTFNCPQDVAGPSGCNSDITTGTPWSRPPVIDIPKPSSGPLRIKMVRISLGGCWWMTGFFSTFLSCSSISDGRGTDTLRFFWLWLWQARIMTYRRIEQI